MSYGCPLCNGFTQFHDTCIHCGHNMDDEGRYSDYFGDYSPYREIDDLALTNGIPTDVSDHQCVHIIHCESC
ncbi:MAG: hypothetical protein WD907_06355, partial [Bacilli bacterium]